MRLCLCLALTLLSPAASFPATISYSYERLTNLGFQNLIAMNNRGWIVGTGPGGRPFRYRTGIGGEPLANHRGYAADINDAGTVVGSLELGVGSARKIKAIVRPAGQRWTDIGTLGGSASRALAINEIGQVTGSAETADGLTHAFLYTAEDGMTDLGTLGGDYSSAEAINEAGQILGTSQTSSGDYHTFLYDPGSGMIDLTELVGDGFSARFLSDNGTVAGGSGELLVYSPSIGLRNPAGGDYPSAISDRGWVVGNNSSSTQAFLYVYGRGAMDLNSLVPGLDPTLTHARDINDRDQILAWAFEDRRWYLLSRIRQESSLANINSPEPSTWLLLSAGLAAVALGRKLVHQVQ